MRTIKPLELIVARNALDRFLKGVILCSDSGFLTIVINGQQFRVYPTGGRQQQCGSLKSCNAHEVISRMHIIHK